MSIPRKYNGINDNDRIEGEFMKEKLVYLKDRLNDLSKRNRSIRMLKLYDKWAFDISNVNKLNNTNAQTVVERIVAQKGNVELVKQNMQDDISLVLSRKLTNLFRNIKGIEEETGLYDLYMGFPFITGKMLDGTFIRAPLFLYPVRLEKEKAGGTRWKVYMEEGQPQLNRTLFLAFKKFSGIDIPEVIFEEAEEQAKEINYLNWISWLKTHSLNILWSNESELQVFKDYKQDEIPEFAKGQFQLENMAVLGVYPQGNSALLKDYEDLISFSEDNEELGIIKEFLSVGDGFESSSEPNHDERVNPPS